MIDSAKKSIDIAQYYWTLTDGKDMNSAYGGEEGLSIYNKLIEVSKRGVKIRIVQVDIYFIRFLHFCMYLFVFFFLFFNHFSFCFKNILIVHYFINTT